MEEIKSVAEIISNLISSLGIVVAGIWAYRKFYRRNEGQWNANFSVKTEIITDEVNEKIIRVNIAIDNIGNKNITPTNNGLEVSLYRADTEVQSECIVDSWEAIEGLKKDILTVYKNSTGIYDPNCDYKNIWSLDPGAIYTERFIIRLNKNGMYQLKCRLHIKDKNVRSKENTLTEYDYFLLNG